MAYKHDRMQVKRGFKCLIRQYERLFYYSCEVDRWLPEITMIPYVTLGWKQVPLWCRIIAPPSSGKSAHLSLLSGYAKTYMLDEFTTKCFVSGYRGQNEDPSKLPQMDGKVFIITDESTIMQQRTEERNLMQAILRKAYDGSFSKGFGNIKDVVEHKADFNMLVAATPIIDRFFTYNQALGERYLNYRLQIPNRRALVERAIYNQKHGYKKQHAQLQRAVQIFLKKLPKTNINSVILPRSIERTFIQCSDFVALARTHVSRDATGRQVTTMPQPEVACRLVEQMIQLAVADAVLHGVTHVDLVHADKAIYIALCSMPTITAYLLYKMWRQTKSGCTKFTIQSMILDTGIGRQTISQHVENLAIHKILKMARGFKQGGRAVDYQLQAWVMRVIDDTKLFQYYRPLGRSRRRKKRKDRWIT